MAIDELGEILEHIDSWPKEQRQRALELLTALESGEADDWRIDDAWLDNAGRVPRPS